jgi:hypothetical protein
VLETELAFANRLYLQRCIPVQLNCGARLGPFLARAFPFGRIPVIRREINSPEARRRIDEFETHFQLSSILWTKIRNGAGELFVDCVIE